MRREEKLLGEIADINDILKKGEVIRIAMVDKGEPYLVPMSFGVREGVIYLHCAKEGRKIDVLRAHSRVSFEVSCDTKLVKENQSCGWTYHFRSVIGTGDVVFVKDKAEKLEGLQAIMEKYGSDENVFPDKAVDATMVLRIDIDEMTGKSSPAKK
ncbi:MAG: pyridoxamine 5'-phosphate oxidase family protein [Denitrovibrio sp.]|nr:MAG: pyridoxamine 5'-phosphate oxidase family protein [Denitrovibrio sp.]